MSYRMSFLGASFVLALFVAGCGGGKDKAATPDPGKPAAPAKAETPKAPLIEKKVIADWCPEHEIPESICSMCSEKYAEECKKKNDWCKEHNRAESQCFICHPEAKAKFAAMKPKDK